MDSEIKAAVIVIIGFLIILALGMLTGCQNSVITKIDSSNRHVPQWVIDHPDLLFKTLE